MGNSKCGKCRKLSRVKGLIYFKGQFICHHCKQKKSTLIMSNIGEGTISLEKALSKTYKIKGYVNKNGSLICPITFPICLAEKTIKISLVDDENNNKE